MAGRERSTSLLIRGAVLLPVVLVLGACNNWTMYGGDATHSGYISSESTIGVRNVGSLVERGTSAPVSGTISSPPTVAGDVLYATADTADNSAGGTLYAYSADRSTNCSTPPASQTCKPLWTEMPGGTNHGLTSSPAVDTSDGVVYVGSKDGILTPTVPRAAVCCGSRHHSAVPSTRRPHSPTDTSMSPSSTGGHLFSMRPTVLTATTQVARPPMPVWSATPSGETALQATSTRHQRWPTG